MQDFFLTKEQYDTFKQLWADRAHGQSLSAADMVFFNLVKGRDLKTGFQPCNSGRQRGNDPWFAFKEATTRMRMWKIWKSEWQKWLNLTESQDQALLEATKNG